MIAVQDAEIGLRGYLLTGDATSLEPYERARLRIESSMRNSKRRSPEIPTRRVSSKSFVASRHRSSTS